MVFCYLDNFRFMEKIKQELKNLLSVSLLIFNSVNVNIT